MFIKLTSLAGNPFFIRKDSIQFVTNEYSIEGNSTVVFQDGYEIEVLDDIEEIEDELGMF